MFLIRYYIVTISFNFSFQVGFWWLVVLPTMPRRLTYYRLIFFCQSNWAPPTIIYFSLFIYFSYFFPVSCSIATNSTIIWYCQIVDVLLQCSNFKQKTHWDFLFRSVFGDWLYFFSGRFLVIGCIANNAKETNLL